GRSRRQARQGRHCALCRDRSHLIFCSDPDPLRADSFIMRIRFNSLSQPAQGDVMRVGFFSLALIISLFVAALSGFAQQAYAMRITFVQAPQNPNQIQPQQGLPPEKKKSLSKYGPEDVFGTSEQEESRTRDSAQPRRSKTKPTPAPKPSASPVATPSVAPTQPAAAPSPTIDLSSASSQTRRLPPTQQSLSSQDGSKWTVPVLLGLAWVVSAALIFVLIKLIGKLREGGNN